MRSFLRCTLLALPLLGGVVAERPSTQAADASTSIYANAQEAFQDLLNALPEESLQAALNSLTKFKAGVFESHRRGVEHVHNSSPALATKLIVAAVQDLKKRQAPAPSNGTSTAEPSQTPDQPSSTPQQSIQQDPTSSQAPASTGQQTTEAPPATTTPTTPASRPVVVPVEVTTTNNAGNTVIQTSEVLSEATASVQVTVTRTTTNDRGSTVAVTTQEVRPAVIRTTTDSRGSSIAITSAGNLAPTRGEVLTTTNAEGSTFLTTYTPGGGKVSSVKLLTTTDAEGRPETLTTIIEVNPTEVAGNGDAGSSGTATQTGRPSVQSGTAPKNHAALAGLAGLGAFALLV